MRLLALAAIVVAAAVFTSAATSSTERFELPYDLVVARDGTVFFPDRARILALDPRNGDVRVHVEIEGAKEIVGLARLPDGSFVAADLPGERLLRIRPGAQPTLVANVPAPVDLVADPGGRMLWVASIAPGVGLVRVDLRTGRTRGFAPLDRPHSVDRLPSGDLVAHDGRRVSRVNAATGAVTRIAGVDAVKVIAGRDGVVYGTLARPSGGRVVRIARGGRVRPIAGTGRLGRHRDGPALRSPMLPSALAIGSGRSLYVAQFEPVPAIRRLDLRTGRITTLAYGREP